MSGLSTPASLSAGTTMTIRLRDIYDPKPQPPKAPVQIRPPPPKPATDAGRACGPSCVSPTKTSMRKRAQSLPRSFEKKKGLRRTQVRFIDALGLDLEEVKVFKAQERPVIPEHVVFRLLMNSELAFGKSPELSLPYFKPCFPDNPAAQPDFTKRLVSQGICLEQLACSELGISGSVLVLNLAYKKEVTVHYSFTNWRTHMEATARWASRGHHRDQCDGLDTDVFKFHLPVPTFVLQPGTVLEFAVRFRVGGRDFWDNNDGCNYKLSCHSYKVTVPKECEGSLLHFT